MVIRIIRHVQYTLIILLLIHLVVEFKLLLACLLFEKELILIRLMSVCVLDFFEGSRNWLRGRLSRTILK